MPDSEQLLSIYQSTCHWGHKKDQCPRLGQLSNKGNVMTALLLTGLEWCWPLQVLSQYQFASSSLHSGSSIQIHSLVLFRIFLLMSSDPEGRDALEAVPEDALQHPTSHKAWDTELALPQAARLTCVLVAKALFFRLDRTTLSRICSHLTLGFCNSF